MQFVFIVSQIKGCRNILKLSCQPLAFTSYEAFLTSKKRFETSFPGLFFAWPLKKNNYLVIFYYLTKFDWLVAFPLWDIDQYVYYNVIKYLN